jgi:hypothetical protein
MPAGRPATYGDLREERSMATADMWVDPVCPWTWLTAQWVLEVERVRDVHVTFRVMSLAVLNEDNVELRALLEQAQGPVRLLTVTELAEGSAAVRALYLALGALIHLEGRHTFDRDFYAAALHRAGLPFSLANAVWSPYYDADVRARHETAVAPVGGGLGSPIIHMRQSSGELVGFFGPVVNRCPRGEAAGLLWDSVVLAAENDTFFELKRNRTGGPIFD